MLRWVLVAAIPAFAEVVAITGATVVDGTGAPPRKATVVMDGARIAGVGVPLPAGARVINAEGHTLTPGFFDLHTHMAASAISGIGGDWPKHLAAYLLAGVTSIADYGSYGEMFAPLRRLLDSGVVLGPRIHFAARLTTPGGHGGEAGRGDFHTLEVETPAEARAALSRLFAYQPDAIKVFTDGWRYGGDADMTSMEEPVLKAIVAAARPRGIEVMTHTVTLERAKQAARSGVDVIVHGIGDFPVDSELISLMRRSSTAYTPTMATYEHKTGFPPLLEKLLEPAAWAALQKRRVPVETAYRRRRWENLTANIGLLHRGGIAIGNGTDSGVTGTIHGWAALHEMELLAAHGLTPLEALTAATGVSARAIHVDGDRGTIAPGKLADLVLIEGAPHETITDARNVRRIWLGGKEVDRARLAALLAAPGRTRLPATKATPLIDDFEAERTSLGTLRVNATDSTHAHSRMMFQRIARDGSGHALALQALMSHNAQPFVWLRLPLRPGAVEPMDASGFQGVQFEARGAGSYSLLVERLAIRAFNFPKASFEATGTWRTVRLAFPGPAHDLQAITFEIARPPGETSWLELDNVKFY